MMFGHHSVKFLYSIGFFIKLVNFAFGIFNCSIKNWLLVLSPFNKWFTLFAIVAVSKTSFKSLFSFCSFNHRWISLIIFWSSAVVACDHKTHFFNRSKTGLGIFNTSVLNNSAFRSFFLNSSFFKNQKYSKLSFLNYFFKCYHFYH